MKSVRTLAVIATLAAIAAPSIAVAGTPLSAKQKFAWEAAQALYGKGLKIKRSKKAVTIKAGSLTQDLYDRYVKEVYLPTMTNLSAGGGAPGRWRSDYRDKKWDHRGPTKYAYILLEPAYKFALCRRIADDIAFTPTMEAHARRKSWCAYQAMIEAFTPILEYRGTAVTWKGNRSRGDLKLDDEIFKAGADGHYPIVVTVAGGREIMSKSGNLISGEMLRALNSDFAPKLHRKATKLWKDKARRYHKFEKKVIAKQRKLARGKVLFSTQRFGDSLALPGAKGPIPCSKSFVLAYAPRKRRRQGYYVSSVIDGKECSSMVLAPGERFATEFHITTGCRDKLRAGTKHTLSMAVHTNIIYGSVDTTKFNKYKRRFQTRTFDRSKKGKKLYSASIECTVK